MSKAVLRQTLMKRTDSKDPSFFLTGQQASELKKICDELCIKEEELQPRGLDWFYDPRLSPDVIKLRHDHYEMKRQEKLKLIKKAMRDKDPTASESELAKLPRTQSANSESHDPPSVNPMKQIEEIIRKEKDELLHWRKQTINRAQRFEEEVSRIEERILRTEERSMHRSREHMGQSEDARKKRTEIENRRINIKEMIQTKRQQDQRNAVQHSRTWIKNLEDGMKESKRYEKKLSRRAYDSFMEKARNKIEKYGSYIKRMKQEAETTDRQLAEYNEKMMKSEKLSNKKKMETVRIASAAAEKVKVVYNRSLVEKLPKVEKLEKLYRKYVMMASLSKKKQKQMEEKWKKGRDNYLKQLERTNVMRKRWDEVQEEKASEVNSRRAVKDQQAVTSKQAMYEELKNRFEVQKSKMLEAKQKVMKLREEEVKSRQEIMRRELLKEQQTSQILSYKRHVRTVKQEVALQLRSSSPATIDYNNPYVVAQMRATQVLSRKRTSPKMDEEKTGSESKVDWNNNNKTID